LQAGCAQETGDWTNLIQLAPLEYWQMLTTAEHFTAEPNGWKWPSVVLHADCSLAHA
jgi:hypothetical protein